jgi:hypothetical protein
MAGAGAKKFPAFSKLSSDDVNNYLADQVIMRFATTTARDAAFGGVGEPTLAEGMTAYIDADNSIYTYDGSNWVKMVSASTPVGMELVKTQTIGNSVSAEIVTGAFSANYDDYLITVSNTLPSIGGNWFEFGFDTAATTGFYGWSYGINYLGTVVSQGRNNLGSLLITQTNAAVGSNSMAINVSSPFLATRTSVFSNSSSGTGFVINGGDHNPAASQTQFFIRMSGGTMTGGTIRVYGYRK